MLRSAIIVVLLFSFYYSSQAAVITGLIADTKGSPLPYASVSIKGTTKGTTANSVGIYSISLPEGKYTLVCQYVGYSKEEKIVTVTGGNVKVDFSLSLQELTLSEVVIKQGEDPAYAIIREAIKKRDYYNHQVDSFKVDIYIKGLLRSRGLPRKVFGQEVERSNQDGLDSLGKGILFLTESLTKVAYKKPDKMKYEVISSRASGGGFGLSFPLFINFYQNNVSVFNNSLNPRGFVSPIADGAISYYKFRYEGSFMEDNKMVNTISVIPRRKNEPLFSGTIQITEDDWRIYSLDLLTTNAYQLEMIDSLRISQIHSAVKPDTWKTKNQVVYVAAKKLGFDITGNFVNVYSDYDLQPVFPKKYFDRIVMKYDTAFNKKDTTYWNNIRPIALENDEARDYTFKDSINKVYRDSFYSKRNIDSLRRSRKPVTIKSIFWTGATRSYYNKKMTAIYKLSPLLKRVSYNTVEGVSAHVDQSLSLLPRRGKYNFRIASKSQYGFSNTHLNSHGELTIQRKTPSPRLQSLQLAGGKRLVQFNADEPILPLLNSLYTLLGKQNYMKVYENWFGSASLLNRYDNGLSWKLHATWEDRLPVENTTDFSFFNKDKTLLPNHPYELKDRPFEKHQALVAGVAVSWQPGQRYIQFPWSKVSLGSSYPTFELEYERGVKELLGSDVDFDKWKFTVSDNVNLKLRGEFKYRVSIGGFINDNRVEIPDLRHFNGNQTFTNRRYLNSFQIAPYYKYSNSEEFYALGHVEHHFNGLLSNKIPLFNKLKWYFVAGANAFYVNRSNYYAEAFAGIENIFKIFRVDFINAYQPGSGNSFGVRVGLGGLFGGLIKNIDPGGESMTIGN
jgi:hypothetical protein